VGWSFVTTARDPIAARRQVGVVTIAARNYLASVLLLGESLARVMPDWLFTAVVIDASGAELEVLGRRWPSMRFVSPESLPIEASTRSRMQLYYDLTEYATAIKSAALQWQLEETEVAVYLDPDIEVFSDLSLLAEGARSHGVALTPHVTAPSPRDFKDTSEEAFLTTGQFNLGFIAVSDLGAPFLDYWAERLERHARIDTAAGYFTDQRWVDAVPILFDHLVVRDHGFNVAYWNLHQRTLSDAPDGGVLVDGAPLRFFHYSGHDARQPLILSKYAPNTRVSVAAAPTLRRVLLERAERVTAKELEVETPSYRWARLEDGRVVPPELRGGYWHAVDSALRSGSELPPAPGWTSPSPDFDSWLVAPTRGGIPRQASLFWRGSTDAQRRFPDPVNQRTSAYLGWLLREHTFVSSASSAVRAAVRAAAAVDERPPPTGANVIGYLAGEFGMGSLARGVASSIRASGFPVALVPIDAEGHDRRRSFEVADGAPRYAVNVIVANADELANTIARSDLWDAIQPRPTVGVWAWELSEMPESMVEASVLLDEIWCGSSFTRDALVRSGAQCEVLAHPWAVEIPEPTRLTRADLGLDEDRFLFGFSFDFRSVLRRKNPLGLLEAYLECFDESDGAGLVLKAINGASHPEREQLAAAAAGRSDVLLIDGHWSALEMRAFPQLLDAYVSLHRAEGTGLTLLDAMASGTPVVATGYSGNVDFMDPTVAKLIPFSLVEVGEGASPYPATSLWAEPDLEVAAQAMRSLLEDPKQARVLGAAGQASVAERCSRDQVAKWYGDRLEEICKW
jgi:glycosyltransferase involved in cell wall biosynthesis